MYTWVNFCDEEIHVVGKLWEYSSPKLNVRHYNAQKNALNFQISQVEKHKKVHVQSAYCLQLTYVGTWVCVRRSHYCSSTGFVRKNWCWQGNSLRNNCKVLVQISHRAIIVWSRLILINVNGLLLIFIIFLMNT